MPAATRETEGQFMINYPMRVFLQHLFKSARSKHNAVIFEVQLTGAGARHKASVVRTLFEREEIGSRWYSIQCQLRDWYELADVRVPHSSDEDESAVRL